MKKVVSVIPFYKQWGNNKLFDRNFGRDNALEPYIKLKEYLFNKGYEINTEDINKVDESYQTIFLRLDIKKIFKTILCKKKSIYIQFEPPVIMPIHSIENMRKIGGLFDVILTWNDDLVDNIKFFKFYFPMPNQSNKIEYIPFRQKKMLTNISGYKLSKRKNELYSKRIEAIRYFEKNAKDDFEFYGVGWNSNDYPSYKGKVENKLDILKNYKFSLCYENECGLNGLISEKIFDCFYARTIPIFWGAENIDEYIPKKCYIDKREYSSYEELHNYLINMTEEEYNERINEIEIYLKSESFKKHSPEYFAETVYKNIKNCELRKENKAFLLASLIIIKIEIVNYGKSIVRKLLGRK